ncbi:MAG: hypothetical protein IK066_03865, partial [Kiritimatiellae bacterium]|nr:hypothetical protein [Kiritimatiellia bacterium]
PGCAGGFVAVGLYAHGMASFGALLAMSVATLGDDGLFLLAKAPGWGLGLTAGLLALGVASGWIADFLWRGRKGATGGEEGHYPVHEHDRAHRPWGAWEGLGWRRAALLAGLVLFSVGTLAGWLGDAGGGGEEEAAVEWGETAAKWLFGGLGLAAAACVWKSSEHFVGEHLWKHIVRLHVPKVLLWTLGVLAAVKWAEGLGAMDGLMDGATGRWLAVGGAIALGWIPTAGPNLLVIGLFARGMVPAEALIANSIVQDGHASLALLAETRKGFFLTKGLKTLLAVGAAAAWGWLAGG